MTTASWSTRLRHDSDAVFREWGLEFNTKLAAVGLIQTTDTGQINWATVVRAGTNAEAGYEIWRFNDAMQGTAPIYLRIGYGTGSIANAPRIQITVGTGSNGSGTITGTALSVARNVHQISAAQIADTARQSYMCHADGFFGFSWKQGASTSEAAFFICRTCDNAGTPNEIGAMIHWANGGLAAFTARQAMRFAAPATAYTAQTAVDTAQLGFSPQAPINTTTLTSDIQVMLGWTITPRAEPLFGVCGVYASELTPGGTFSATLVGSTPRTYLTLTGFAGPFSSISTASTGGLNIAMLWE